MSLRSWLAQLTAPAISAPIGLRSPVDPVRFGTYSAAGHRFTPNGDATSDTCLTCGAVYTAAADPEQPAALHHSTWWGADPEPCSGDTDRVHGYPGDRWCLLDDTDDCEHTQHSCTCLLCDS